MAPDSGRRVLPIPHQAYDGPVAFNARDQTIRFPPIQPLRPPAGAPNVLIVLLDDVGFGASSAFGGPCHTPTADRLAGGGLRYNRFHTTALCSPTRGGAADRPQPPLGRHGRRSPRPPRRLPATARSAAEHVAPLAETLKLNGYSTAQFGKCHEVPVWQTSPMGPFDAWPTGGGGFEYFYGFIGGETNQCTRRSTTARRRRAADDARGGLPLHRGHDRPRDRLGPPAEGADARQAVLRVLRARRHPRAAPRARRSGSDKYKGQFDDGWDALREETLARQKELGVVPPTPS